MRAQQETEQSYVAARPSLANTLRRRITWDFEVENTAAYGTDNPINRDAALRAGVVSRPGYRLPEANVTSAKLQVKSIVSKSQQRAQLLTFFVAPPLTLFPGASSPLENLPDFFQRPSYPEPLRYREWIDRGVTLKRLPGALWPNLLALLEFSVILFGLNAWRSERRAQVG
jgi:hypothetical protein